MAKCDYCGKSIWLGGERAESRQFCSRDCRASGLMALSAEVPDDEMRRFVEGVYRGACPECKGPGPVDLQTYYTIWSAAVMTSYATKSKIACRPCGQKARIGWTFGSFLLGWWGIPWGLIMTPVQITRNIVGLFERRKTDAPTYALESALRKSVALGMLREEAEALKVVTGARPNAQIVS